MKTGKVFLLLVFLSSVLSSCSLIADIFKAGIWVGILMVVGIVALIIYLISKAKK